MNVLASLHFKQLKCKLVVGFLDEAFPHKLNNVTDNWHLTRLKMRLEKHMRLVFCVANLTVKDRKFKPFIHRYVTV